MEEKTFKITRWYAWATYASIPVSLVFGVLFLVGLYMSWRTATIPQFVLSLTIGPGFIVGGFYTMTILPRLRDVITISDQSIIQTLADGDRVEISWEEEIAVRNRTVMGRLDVIAGNGERVIRVEHQLAGYRELVSMMEKRAKHVRFV